jgi:hypothetical protein
MAAMVGSLQRLASYSVGAALPACRQTKAQDSASAQSDRGQILKAYRGVCAMNLSLYLLTVLIWGTTWIALKWQLGVVAP